MALLIREPQVKAVINAARANSPGKGLLVVNAGNNGFNRAIIQIKGVHVIRHLHKTEKNSFDHIIARMSAENHVAIDIDLRPLVMSRGVWRQKTIQRYKDIIGLCERFEFPLTLSSNARSVVELKSVREMVNLASLVGIAEPDAREALAVIKSLIAPGWPCAGGRMRPRPPTMRDKRRYVLAKITPSWVCPETKSHLPCSAGSNHVPLGGCNGSRHPDGSRVWG